MQQQAVLQQSGNRQQELMLVHQRIEQLLQDLNVCDNVSPQDIDDNLIKRLQAM